MSTLGWGIKPIRSTTVPKSSIVVAAQSVLGGDTSGYTESWRCAVAHFWRNRKRRKQVDRFQPFERPEALWEAASIHCGYEGLTFLWVYDLNWTARVTDMITHLVAIGWDLEAFSLNPGAPWMVWRRARATLKVADAASLWPGSLDLVARLFGTSRVDEPAEDAPYLSWVARARRDCELLEVATGAYTDWVLGEDLGPLAVTGNAQAFRAFRRRFYTHGILVHQDKDAAEAERRAMWTGRCEAYWRGSIGYQVVHEWDLTAAYTNIVREVAVPTFLHGPADPAKPIESYLDDDRYLLLAEVDVETTDPVVPTAYRGGIVWPVGRFSTTLWEPELRALLDGGHAVRLRRGWLYRGAPALESWAGWVLSCLDSTDDVTPAWAKLVVKRWGNVLIGRFAMQYPTWKRMGTSEVSTVGYWPSVDAETGEESAIMQIGHAVWERSGMSNAHDSAPAITGYVMAEARARLWKLMQSLPAGALLYVDTDSLLVTDQWLPEMTELQESHLGRGLRLKRSWTGMAIYGPRQLVTGDSVRIAGLPKRATRTGRHSFAGETTEGLAEAIGAGRADMVHLVPKTWTVAGTDTRRVGSGSGWTSAIRLDDPATSADIGKPA